MTKRRFLPDEWFTSHISVIPVGVRFIKLLTMHFPLGKAFYETDHRGISIGLFQGVFRKAVSKLLADHSLEH